jgi:transcriptional regulator with XRE-family HTH domain
MKTASQVVAVSRLGTATTRKVPTDTGGLDKEMVAHLGRMVRVARVSRGLTQRELAARVKRSQNLIWSVESGKKDPGLVLLWSIARALGIPLDFFVVSLSEPKSTSTKAEQAAFQEGRSLLMALVEGLHSGTTQSRGTDSEKKRQSRNK